MRLYRVGSSGAPIRDIQVRLGALGFPCSEDPPGEFGQPTRTAVLSFQSERGLAPDGIVGQDTWRALYEAGYRLGDRLLYNRRPMFRGDDVAELQRRLNALGFDAGKVDGIFGPRTARAVTEFQQNRHLSEDGVAGPEITAELELVSRATRKTGREAIREREWLRGLPDSIAGARVFLDAASGEGADVAWETVVAASQVIQELGAIPLFSRSADTRPPERVRALRANRLGADLIIGFRLPVTESFVAYFASSKSHSEAGAVLAAHIGRRLALPLGGRAYPLLKETRSPAVVICDAAPTAVLGREVATALGGFFDHQA
jgi:N-acetylmuramoyl-L-alanine amidase